LKIVPLAEHPGLVDQVAAWGFDEWGHLSPGQTLQSRTARVRTELNTDRVPMALVAIDPAGALVGSASLILDDLEGDPRNPWLASVFVPPDRRRRGIASALVGAVEAAARRRRRSGGSSARLLPSLSVHDIGRRPLRRPRLARP
jgi:GNAT superfamily N-acetyltransferase